MKVEEGRKVGGEGEEMWYCSVSVVSCISGGLGEV